MSITTETTSQWEAVFETLPTVAEGWTTVKAVAEVVGMTPSTVTRRLNALEEGGRVESSVDKAVTGVRGRAWRQRPGRPHLLGGVETVELPASDDLPADVADDGPEDLDSGEQDRQRPDGCTGCTYLPGPEHGVRVASDPACPVHGGSLVDDEDGDPSKVLIRSERTSAYPLTESTVDHLVDDEDGDPSPVSPAPTGGDYTALADWMAGQQPTDPLTLTADAARALTDRIRLQVTDLLPLIRLAYNRRADLALGYESWAAYCDTELRGLRMPLAERQAATVELRGEGMSTRAIAGALGSSDATVRRDLEAAGPADVPDRSTGLDGRSYPARKPKTAADAGNGPPAAADGAEGVVIPTDDTPATGDGGGDASPAVPGGNPLVDLRGVPFVWIAAARKGIEYHRPGMVPSLNLTFCGRSMRTGTHLARDVAEQAHEARPCPRCWPTPGFDAAARLTPAELGTTGGADTPQAADDAALDNAERERGAHTRQPAPADEPLEGEVLPEAVAATEPAEALNLDADAPTKVAAAAPVEALEGEVLPAVVDDPNDPGPVPDPPLDPRIADAIVRDLGGLALAIGNLAVLLRDAGPHAGGNLHALRHWRHELDRCIRLAERA
jgi:hypothetical protein